MARSYNRELDKKKQKFESTLLGICRNKARRKLIRRLVYQYFLFKDNAICKRCNKHVLADEDWHIDHIRRWIQQKNPIKAFFDLNNLSIAHARCNLAWRKREKV